MNNRPFFNVHSPALRDMLGVEDVRSVKAQLKEMGVQLCDNGKYKYIITSDVLEALERMKKNRQINTGYTPKGKLSII